MKKLLLVINEDRFFFSHRKDVALAALHDGWEVTLVAADTGRRREVEALGIRFLHLPVNPRGRNLLEELRTFRFLLRLYRRNRDAIVHHVGMKNMLWGSMAARIAGVAGVLNAVSGLGTLFADGSPVPLRRAILRLLRVGMRHHNLAVIFQNHEDENLFIAHGLTRSCHVSFIKGSGVDLGEYALSPIPQSSPAVVIFTARMLRQKGVADLVEAARILRPEMQGRVEFWLCGALTSHPDGLKRTEIEAFADGSYIRWLGHRSDIADLLRRSTVMAFPSYYREGMPRSLIEASAVGRPIVTCDSVGCRDSVEEGVNGFRVPPRSPAILADRLRTLLDNPQLCQTMGRESRRIAERDYDIRDVVAEHLRLYALLQTPSKNAKAEVKVEVECESASGSKR